MQGILQKSLPKMDKSVYDKRARVFCVLFFVLIILKGRYVTVELIRKWNEISLVKRIVLGLIVGAILGAVIPSVTVIAMLGSLFVGALKALAPMLVFFIVMNALAHLKKGGKTNMSTVVVLYLIGTFAAALTAVVASFAFPSTLLLDASAGDVL